jgi:hypothetical protein
MTNEPAAWDRAWLRILVTSQKTVCPYVQENPDECPLHALRDRPLLERVNWSESLSHLEVSRFMRYHTECLALQQAKLPNHPGTRGVS